MWKKIDTIKLETPQDLLAMLSLTIATKPQSTTMYSFSTSQENVTYLINQHTLPFYNPNILQEARNIKAWDKVKN